MKVVVLSSSLNPGSRSRIMALSVAGMLERFEGLEVDRIDLQGLDLPLCDGGAAYGDPSVVELNQRFEAADAYVLATPVYNFDGNAALKNVIELAGRKMENKMVGFVCAAGGAMSYMSIMALASSLMLDFRTIVLPRFVYAAPGDWEGDELKPAVAERLEQFATAFETLGRKLLA